jgi:hypothetical protein
MQPIATYSEVRFEGKRTFTLFADKIVVRGKQSLQSEFDVTIALTKLDPTPDILRFRSKGFTAGMWNAVIGFVGCTILVSGFHMSFATLPPGLLACIGMSGILLMAATARKVEFIRFKNDGGLVILDLARSGKHAAQLDAFIDALTKQIRTSRGTA